MAYGDFKNLGGRAASDKVSCNEAFGIASNPKYSEYERGLSSMFQKFFDKNLKGSGATFAETTLNDVKFHQNDH